MTLVEMLKRDAELFPDKTALIYGESIISYSVLFRKSNALANLLLGIGLKKGEKVGLLLKKTPEAIISFLGVAVSGGVVFPIDYNQTLTEIQFILNLTRPSVLIVAADFQALLSKLRLPCRDNKIIVVGQKVRKQYHMWDELITHQSITAPDIATHSDDIVYLNFTSGTTGVPKGAISTHANIYWNTLSSVEALGLTHEDIHLCMFPVFGHPHELFARPIYLGGTIVLIDNISPKSIVGAILDHNVTCMMATASIYETLVRFHESHPFNIDSLRIPESGGMHVNPSLAKGFENRFKIPVLPVWGSTETMGIALATPVEVKYKLGSMGKPCPYYEVKIVGDDGKELPPNNVGEMVIKGPAVFSEYLGNPEETEKHIRDGWFFTGDLVKKDSEDYFYFIGRKSGMIKVAGLKVFPIEIEEVLSTHPQIAEVAVVKASDHSHGEVPKAVIVLKDGVRMSKTDIRKYCEERMSRYKVPRIIEFVTELPKSLGGKILYRKL
jgi:long-chain acyl-CoA synthetase